jgi:hypothetical protein
MNIAAKSTPNTLTVAFIPLPPVLFFNSLLQKKREFGQMLLSCPFFPKAQKFYNFNNLSSLSDIYNNYNTHFGETFQPETAG